MYTYNPSTTITTTIFELATNVVMRESSYSTLTTTASTVKGLIIASGSSSSSSDNGANYNNLNNKEDYYIHHNRTPPNRTYQFNKYNSNCIRISNNVGQMRLPLHDSSVLNSNSHHYSSFTSTTTSLFRTLLQNPTLIFILAICLSVDRHTSIIPSVLAVPSFRYDCSNNLHKEIACSVHIVDCNEELVEWISNDSLQLLPSAVHDIRVEPFSRAMPRRSQQKYQLSVDISWQMPPDNSTSLLKAFLLEISPADGTSSDSSDNHHPSCFLFNVTQSDWTTELITSSPRFHFSTESIFEFDGAYNVILTSLPRSQTQQNSVTKYVVMPRHPELSTTLTDATFDCSKYSNPQASKWTAGFRRIFVHSLARTIQIEFVGAPAHYCFEAYEVRLKDETGLDLLYSSIIPVQSMRSETIDNNTVLFGEYNFTDLELERDYVPSVIPIERADDGRCLCPVSGNDPFDNRVVCSCIAADWKKVRLHRLERPTVPPMVTQLNGTIIEAASHSDSDVFWTIVVLSILVMAFLVLLLIIYALYMFYHRYRAHTKIVQIRFISNNLRSSNALLTHPSSSISRTPLIHNLNPNVLLIYTHDCCAHEAAVLALAEYLRDIFSFDVHLDVWESDEIERNFMDYISSSILNADKVMIVNSMGAYLRYQNKVEHRSRVERKQHTLYDNLYESQIDQALMHPCVVSVRFTYTPYSMVLPPLGFSLQYVLPDNIAPLLSNLTDSNMKYDSRLFTYNAAQVKLNSAITRMRTLVVSDPNWFQQTHHRVPLLIKSSVQPVEPLTDNGDVHSSVYPEHALRTVDTVVSGVVPHQAMPTATTIAENLSDDSGVVNSTSVALEYDDQQQLRSSQSLSQEQSVESLPSRKQSTSAAVIALSNPLTNPPSTDIEDEGCQRIEMTSSNNCNGDDRDQDGYDIQTPATTNYPLLNGGIKIDARFALRTPLLLNGADGEDKKKNANKIVGDQFELRDKNQQANHNTKQQQQQQNGHINGVMGRLMKGFISQQQPQQHDSGLIVDMDSVDIPSS